MKSKETILKELKKLGYVQEFNIEADYDLSDEEKEILNDISGKFEIYTKTISNNIEYDDKYMIIHATVLVDNETGCVVDHFFNVDVGSYSIAKEDVDFLNDFVSIAISDFEKLDKKCKKLGMSISYVSEGVC